MLPPFLMWPTSHANVAGWKFWVPAASVNFFAVPVPLQVWYMSACGLLWVAYLSYSSSKTQAQRRKEA